MSFASAAAGVIAGGRERAPVNKWVVALSVSFGTLMGAIDASIVNVAIPHLQGSLGATITEITWVTTGFTIANVVVMPLTAFLASLFGQKRVYMTCLGLFLVGSVFCGMARSLAALVIFRAIQGLGAGALQPTEQAILRQTFPPEEQGMAMALFGLAVMIGPAVGPTLGGYLVDNFSWPWIFFINLPVGALGLTLVWRYVHEPEDIKAANRARAEAQKKNMDWAGIALLSVGVAMLQYILEEGNRLDWFDSPLIAALAALSFFLLVAFVLRELTAPVPAVRLRLFKDKVFLSGTLISGVMFSVMLANMFLLPVFMQELLGYTATQSGIALMPRVLAMMVVIPFVGRLYNHVDARVMVCFGVVLQVIGAYWMSRFTLEISTFGIILPLIIQGVGTASLFVPLTTAAISTIPRPQIADATGLYSLSRQIGGSFGLAIFATLLGNFQIEAKAALGSHLTATNPTTVARLSAFTHGLIARGVDAITAQSTALRMLDLTVSKQAMVIAFERTFFLGGLTFLLVLPLALLLKIDRSVLKPKSAGAHEVHLEA